MPVRPGASGLLAPLLMPGLAPFLALQQTDPFSLVGRLLGSPYTKATLAVMALLVASLYLALVWWTFADSTRRGALRLPWTTAAILFPFAGTLIYVLCRPPEYVLDARERELELVVLEHVLAEGTQRCPRCDSLVRPDFLACPYCQQSLKEPCEGCGRPLEEDWNACPHCLTARAGVRARSRTQPRPGPDANGKVRQASGGRSGRRGRQSGDQ